MMCTKTLFVFLAPIALLAACQSSQQSDGGVAGKGGGAAGAQGTGGMVAGAGGASGGSAGSGGAVGGGGVTGSGGVLGTGGRASGGAAAAGGALGQGGTRGLGGASGPVGGQAAGGASGRGGALGFGGAQVAGGTSGKGGASGAGGGSGRGGTSGSGGTSASGAVQMVDAARVRLLAGSPFYERQELHRKGYLAQLNTDKLLYPYRSVAKLAQAGGATSGYAGWDTGFIQGHMLGHYLSAASRMAVATGDTTFKTKVDYLVAELAKCQTGLGSNGYLAAFPTAAFDVLEGKGGNANGIVVPYYTVQKIMNGLLDAYHYLGNQQALDVVTKMGDYFQTRLAGLPAATLESIFRTDGSKNPQNEFGSMADAYAELSVATGQKKYLDTAKLFNRSWFMTPLASGQDKLEGLHGNTHVAQALGIAHTANLSGDSTSLQASENFWKLITTKHAFMIGGNSFHEWLGKGGVEVGASIDGGASLPPTTAETCNTNNMLRLTSRLFQRGPRMDYADFYERALYNHILSSVAPDTGNVVYFTPLHGHFRTYLNGTFCCNGTGIENTPRYNENIYFEQGSSLWVNLYIPSEVTWSATGLTMREEGNAAAGEPVKISITKGGEATQATINLRIPFWVTGTPTVAVNGTAVEQSVAPSSYLALNRSWKVGDVITLTLPAALRLERARDDASMVAVFFGPIVLAGALGTSGMPSDFADKDAHLSTPAATVPTIANASANPADWLQADAGSPLTFKAQNAGSANGITFQPLYQVHHQRYSVYWPLQAK